MINIGDLLINKETQENYVVLSIVNSHPEEIIINILNLKTLEIQYINGFGDSVLSSYNLCIISNVKEDYDQFINRCKIIYFEYLHKEKVDKGIQDLLPTAFSYLNKRFVQDNGAEFIPERIVLRPKYEDNINIEEMVLLSGDQNYTNGKTSIIVSLDYLHEHWQIP